MPTIQAIDAAALIALERVCAFQGRQEDFWPLFLSSAALILNVNGAILLRRERTEKIAWTRMVSWPSPETVSTLGLNEVHAMEHLANDCLEKGGAIQSRTSEHFLALRLGHEERGRELVGIFVGGLSHEGPGEDALRWVRLLHHIAPRRSLANKQSDEHASLVHALDLALLLNEEREHLPAAMLFCNELASRMAADRASLGWMRGEAIRVVAMSHTNRLEQNLSAVRELEAVMQEAVDQDTETLWPQAEGSIAIVREHEIYGRRNACGQVLSLPIRLDSKICGALTIERHNPRFRSAEIAGLRLACDLSARHLDNLDRVGRGSIRRLRVWAESFLAKLLGPEQTWMKAGAISLSLLLLFLFLYPWPYRIEGNFTLRAEQVVSLPAPFDGYLERVNVRPGDSVEEGQLLAALDPTELKLQEADSLANRRRYESEALLAQGADRISDMRIAQSQAEQAISKLQQVKNNLARAELHSPFSGFVVEGDLREKIGAPTKKGDVLLKISRLDGMYAQVEISERDIHEVRSGANGKLAFTSRPEYTFPFSVERIEPSGQSRKSGTVFLVRCLLKTQPMPEWWRPGMTGLAKIQAGRRPIFYQMTHRLFDFLRLKLWF